MDPCSAGAPLGGVGEGGALSPSETGWSALICQKQNSRARDVGAMSCQSWAPETCSNARLHNWQTGVRSHLEPPPEASAADSHPHTGHSSWPGKALF